MVTKNNKHGAIGTPPNQQEKGMVVALRWLTAIQEATRCLRDDGERRLPAVMEHSLHYLMELEALLTPLESQWDQGPSSDPPKLVPYEEMMKKKELKKMNNNKKKKKNKGKGRNNNNNNKTDMVVQSPTSVVETWKPEEQSQKKNKKPADHKNSNNHNSNRFALFEDSDDDDDEEEETLLLDETLHSRDDGDVITGRTIISSCSRSLGSLDDLYEAGDVPTLNRMAVFPQAGAASGMGMRRLMIRIVTAQSELFAAEAAIYRKTQKWSQAAQNCHASLCKIHQGLMLADSEISRCWATGKCLPQQLEEDASIVEVATKSLTLERDSFVRKALQAKEKLVRKLEAMYIGRYNARLRMGDKWFQNLPRKNHTYASRRELYENGLVEIQMALDGLSQWDSHTLVASANHLKLRLKAAPSRPTPTAHLPRHNKERPKDTNDRVDFCLYPDPTFCGFIFTGSYVEEQGGRRIEFFEKQDMLLDWHYATAQLELKWKFAKHQQSTTLFRSEGPLQSQDFIEIVASKRPWEVAIVKNFRKGTMGGGASGKNHY